MLPSTTATTWPIAKVRQKRCFSAAHRAEDARLMRSGSAGDGLVRAAVKAQTAAREEERLEWEFLRILQENDSRIKFSALLGYNAAELEERLARMGLAEPPPAAEAAAPEASLAPAAPVDAAPAMPYGLNEDGTPLTAVRFVRMHARLHADAVTDGPASRAQCLASSVTRSKSLKRPWLRRRQPRRPRRRPPVSRHRPSSRRSCRPCGSVCSKARHPSSVWSAARTRMRMPFRAHP